MVMSILRMIPFFVVCCICVFTSHVLLPKSLAMQGLAENGQMMIAIPNILYENATISVTWQNLANPTAEDWIGVYCIEDDITWKRIAWKWANNSHTYHLGFGDVSWTLVNLRKDYGFIYWSGGKAVSQSNPVKVMANYPTQLHLALTTDPTQMRVMWTSASTQIPTVEYYTDPKLKLRATGFIDTYNLTDLCANATDWATEYWFDPGMLHDVLLTNLKTNTKYYYRVGNDVDGWSNIFEFVSAKPVGHKTLDFVAYGDMGVDPATYCQGFGWCGEQPLLILEEIQQDINSKKYPYDMILHVGDISYAVGVGIRWDQFMFQIQLVASHVPYMVSLGNHEYDYTKQPFKPTWGNFGDDSSGECGIPYAKRFHMPGATLNGKNLHDIKDQKYPKEQQWWYSYNYGNAHFVLISGEHDFLPGSEQYEWLLEDFQSIDRVQTPWLIVGGHRPMYDSGNYESDWVMAMHIREALEPLFVKYKVDLFLTGHYHSYERTCPVINGTCVEEGPVHVCVGMGGVGESSEWIQPAPNWSMFRASANGYTRIHIDGNKLTFSYIGSRTGTTHDEFTLTK